MSLITINSKLQSLVNKLLNINNIPYCEIINIDSVTPYNAFLSGKTISNLAITEKGFCYSTTNNPPTTADTKTIITGDSINITGLTSGATYYICAYAINAKGIGYSTAHSFTTSNVTIFTYNENFPNRTYYVPVDATHLEYIVVGGGGGGGMNAGSGGGAGGFRSNVTGETSGGGGSTEAWFTPTASTYNVIVGKGGIGGAYVDNALLQLSTNGGDSTFATITSVGGGHGTNGGTALGVGNGTAGGCGSGAARYSGAGTSTGGAGTANQGYSGGNAITTTTNTFCSGGGGGAGASGETKTNGGRIGGIGGAGVTSSITGTAIMYAIGASSDQQTTAGGPGGSKFNTLPDENTGNGGGYNEGTSYIVTNRGISGANGIVVIKAYFD